MSTSAGPDLLDPLEQHTCILRSFETKHFIFAHANIFISEQCSVHCQTLVVIIFSESWQTR